MIAKSLFAYVLAIYVIVNADDNVLHPRRDGRDLFNYIFQNSLPATLLAPLTRILSGSPTLIDTIELATENNLCKKSKQIAQESDVHALTGVRIITLIVVFIVSSFIARPSFAMPCLLPTMVAWTRRWPGSSRSLF